MFGFIGDAVSGAANFVGDVVEGAGDLLGGVAGVGADLVGGALGAAESVLGGAAGLVGGFASSIFDVIEGGFEFVSGAIGSAAGSVEDIIKDLASGAGLSGLEGLDAFSVLFLLLGRLEEQQDANIQGLASLMDKKAALDTESLKKSAGEPNNFDELAARPEFQNLDTNISLLTQKIQRVEQDMQQTKVLSSQLVAREGQSNSQVIGNI